MRELSRFDSFRTIARQYWRKNVVPPETDPADGGRVILVEAMSQDLRVTLRNLTVANALRRMEPASIIVYTGTDADWNRIVWTYYDQEEINGLARAYGAHQIVDLHDLVDRRVAGESPEVTVAGVPLGGELRRSGIDPDAFAGLVDATTARMAQAPRVDDSEPLRAKRAEVERRSVEFADVYETLISDLDVVALVSSHVDYNNFGLATEAALRHDVPVLFPQSTGGLKAYAIFPEHHRPERPVRAAITEQVGEFFEHYVWPNRDLLRTPAELTQWRAKATLGRPSWWRAGRGFSSVDMASADDRDHARSYVSRRLGLDPGKPVVTAFNHAVSDALGTNHEAFDDLAAWFEQTAEYAAAHPEVNWLFLDHPHQPMYDVTGFMDDLAGRYAGAEHMHFMRSLDLSKNAVTALTDLVLTLRGSVSTEYPALGIPAIQAGWSDWSRCGFTTVTETSEEYFAELDRHVAGLLNGTELITPEQIERARSWTWFYRSGTDVAAGLVQHWGVGEGDELWDLIAINMLHAETDAEPAFTSVRRMWKRRDPFLTRIDWRQSREALEDAIAPVGVASPDQWTSTANEDEG